MNSERISVIALEPFIGKFVSTIIKSIQDKNLSYEKKYTIHSDLVPKISKRVMQVSLSERIKPKIIHQLIPPPIQKIIPPSITYREQVGQIQEYGKITPLLNDPSVSTIECRGAEKLIIIIRAGQKQITKISLSAKDIKGILEKISEKVHIPILEGVFRASVDNFSINAVISEMIGSRFVIKKHTAYSMLER